MKRRLFSGFFCMLLCLSLAMPTQIGQAAASEADLGADQSIQFLSDEGKPLNGLGSVFIQGATNQQYYQIEGGVFNKQGISIEPTETVRVVVCLVAYDAAAEHYLAYLDAASMTGVELIQMQSWEFPGDAVETEVHAPLFNSQHNRMYGLSYQGAQFDYLSYDDLVLISKSGEVGVSVAGNEGQDGYVIQKTAEIREGGVISFTSDDTAGLMRLELPEPNLLAWVSGPKNYQGTLYGVQRIWAAGGDYRIHFWHVADGYSYEWHSDKISLKEDTRLYFDTPQLVADNIQFNIDNLRAAVRIRSGDFYLDSVKAIGRDFPDNEISSRFIFSNAAGVKLVDITPSIDYLGHFNIPFEPQLHTDSYKAEIQVNYPGLSAPLKFETENVFLYNKADADGKGLSVFAENENGGPLQEGSVFLYRSLPPTTEAAELGTDVYDTELVYQTELNSDGTAVIPYNKLLKGISYELVAAGAAADGRTPVIYSQAVTREQTETLLTSGGLKHVLVHAAQADDADELIISQLGDQGQFVGYPWVVSFVGQTADAWIQTSHKLDFFTKLYDEANHAGYFLHDQDDMQNSNGRVELRTDDLAEIRLPDGYSGRLDINYGYLQDSKPASRYYITRGTEAAAYFDVDDGGYRYSFFRYLGNVDQDRTLAWDHSFVNDHVADEAYESGAGRRSVDMSYWDTYDNLLLGVSMTTVDDLVRQGSSAHITFNTQVDGSRTTMSVAADPSLQYTMIEPSVTMEPVNVSDTDGQLEYQLYGPDGSAVGGVIRSSSFVEATVDIPYPSGEYTLRLTDQNFPTNLMQLSGQTKFNVLERTEESAYAIKVGLPPGYNESQIIGGTAYLVTDEGYSSYEISDGKLEVPAGDLDGSQNYTVHIAMKLRSEAEGSVQYYTQRQMTGAALEALDELPYPSEARLLKLTLTDIPKTLNLSHTKFKFPSIGAASSFQSSLSVDAAGTDYNSATRTISLQPLLTNVADFSFVMEGSVFGTAAYEVRRNIHVDAATGKWTETDVPTHRITMQNKYPLFSAWWRPTELFGVDLSSLPFSEAQSFNTVYLPTGDYDFYVRTKAYTSDEEAWDLSWIRQSLLHVESEITIPFTGQVEQAQSRLELSQWSTQDGRAILSAEALLFSGDMRLTGVSLSDGTYSDRIPAIVSVENAEGRTVYEATTYNTDVTISRQFDPGSYKLLFRLPTGPGQESVLAKEFAVSAPGGNTGGGDSTGGGDTGGGDNGTGNGGTGNGGTGNGGTDNGGTGNGGTGNGGGTNNGGGDPGSDGAGSGGTGGTGGGGSGGAVEEPGTGKKVFSADNMPAPVNGVVTLNADSASSIAIPVSVLNKNATDSAIEIKKDGDRIMIPPAVLGQLAALIDKSELADAQVIFEMKQIDTKEAALIGQSGEGSVRPVGTVYSFSLSIQVKGDKPVALSSFKEPIKLTFEVNAGADQLLTNVYYISDDGSLAYVPGEWHDGALVAGVRHFSKYGVLEMKRKFDDLRESHWALKAVQELAAKQIVKGVSRTSFAPDKNVTRAEFTSMIVNALGIDTDKAAAFADTPATAWYTGAVAAAYDSGLIKGTGNNVFSPNRPITREEMASIVVGALNRLQGERSKAVLAASFKDADAISTWARTAVETASSAGLIQGDGSGKFNPRSIATRAQAAQIIVNLLHAAP